VREENTILFLVAVWATGLVGLNRVWAWPKLKREEEEGRRHRLSPLLIAESYGSFPSRQSIDEEGLQLLLQMMMLHE
jgi:hypothetical protein